MLPWEQFVEQLNNKRYYRLPILHGFIWYDYFELWGVFRELYQEKDRDISGAHCIENKIAYLINEE